MNLWQETIKDDAFDAFHELLQAYYAGKSADMPRLKLKIRGIWQNCNQQDWTMRLAQRDPVLKAEIEKFNAVIVNIV